MEVLHDEARLKEYFAPLAREQPWLARYPWRLLRYRKGEYLCRYREKVTQLLFLLDGSVTVSLTPPHGRTHIVTFCTPVSLVCGDVEVVLGNTHATADLRADGGSVLCAGISIDDHRAALCSDLGFLQYTAQRLATEMIKDSVYAANNLLFPLDQRLAAYILSASPQGLFRANLTRTAELLGVSYRQLSRVMRGFTQRALLKKDTDGWRVTDRAGLERLSADIETL